MVLIDQNVAATTTLI